MTAIISPIKKTTIKKGEKLVLSNQVFLLNFPLRVEEGGELIVNNAKLLLTPEAGIEVIGGTIKVENTIFTAKDRKEGWNNLTLVKPRGFIANTIFEYAKGTSGEKINRLTDAGLPSQVTHGGAIYIEVEDGDIFEISDCRFYRCNAEFGGAIYAKGQIKLQNCFFENCYAYGEFGSGGAVYASRTSELNGCFFRNCRAVWGGAVYLFDGNQIENSSFVNCRAERDGGALFVWNNNNIFRCSFKNCGTKYWGGAIKSYAFNRIERCHFDGCAAGIEGGALDLMQYNLVNQCTFRRCSATEGGAIGTYYANEIENCIFENCEANRGGALKVENKNKVINNIFDRCGAQEMGGAIYQKGGENELKNNLIIDCYPA